ncbi:MAG: iron-containing redox enzyme family protein [Actinomycetota bacterium]|nr:iron-containing redox enzyme family protein [Actinomycetota bacterium]
MAERTLERVPPGADHAVPSGPPPPQPRGPLSAHVLEHLLQAPHEVPPPPPFEDDPLWGDDAQLALYCCYELHYRSMARVHEGWEWEPSLLALRRTLETALEDRLREELGLVPTPPDVEMALRQAIEDGSGRSLSAYLRDEGTLADMREFAVHRSAYQLKEADPHTWAIPRLAGGPKAAMLEIQFDEYGGGVESAMHSTLFAVTMAALGLDSSYGAYLDLLPGATLATTNVISLFGLHRRWRGALAGHLAAFEATSVTPMARYQEALQRLGIGSEAQRFFEVHVDADAHHEIVGFKALVGGLAAAEPELAADIVFGGRTMMLVEEHFAHHLLDAWSTGGTSLRAPLPAAGLSPI